MLALGAPSCVERRTGHYPHKLLFILQLLSFRVHYNAKREVIFSYFNLDDLQLYPSYCHPHTLREMGVVSDFPGSVE